jgi:hypothetical protein
MEKAHSVNGLSLVADCLVKLLEARHSGSIGQATSTDKSSLTALLNDRHDDPYKTVLVSICKCESILLSQLIPDVTAFDWIWYSLRELVDSGESVVDGLARLRTKIDELPKDYFLDGSSGGIGEGRRGLYPSLGSSILGPHATASTQPAGVHVGKSLEESKAAVQMALMHFLVLNFSRGIEIGLKTRNETFDIESPYHRCLLFVVMALDKYNVLASIGQSIDSVGIVVEAALTIADPKEREVYAGGLSSENSQKFLETLRALDKRRTSA